MWHRERRSAWHLSERLFCFRTRCGFMPPSALSGVRCIELVIQELPTTTERKKREKNRCAFFRHPFSLAAFPSRCRDRARSLHIPGQKNSATGDRSGERHGATDIHRKRCFFSRSSSKSIKEKARSRLLPAAARETQSARGTPPKKRMCIVSTLEMRTRSAKRSRDGRATARGKPLPAQKHAHKYYNLFTFQLYIKLESGFGGLAGISRTASSLDTSAPGL